MSKIKLFCFPYAGGSAAVYNRWKEYLNPEIELRPVELSGRGERMDEPLYTNMEDLIEDVFQLLEGEFEESEYALLGHSMGAMIIYELSRKIIDNNLKLPLHIFFSGHSAPQINRADEKIYHLMKDDEFKREIIGLGGTPPEFFDHTRIFGIIYSNIEK